MKSRVFLLLFLLITVNACPVNALELRGNTVLSYTEGPIPKNIQLYDNSTLIITGVYPETTRYNDTQTLSVDVYDNSSVLLTNSNFQGYVKLYNQSRLEMYDSSLFDARWCSGHHAFHNGSGVICYDSTLLKINSSKIGYLRGYDNSSGVITGSDVMEVNSQTNRGELFNVQFHIINSKVGRVHLYNVNSLLDGYRAGFYNHLEFNQTLGQTIILDNSTLKNGISVTNTNTTLRISNSDIFIAIINNGILVEISDSYIWDLVLWSSRGLIKLDECQVDTLNLIHDQGPTIETSNCKIGRFSAMNNHTLYATNTTIQDYYQGRNSKMVLDKSTFNLRAPAYALLDIKGDFNLNNHSLLEYKSWGHNITVSRTFPVTVTRNKIPVKDALIKVMKDNQTIRSLTTDPNGYSEFSLVFANHHSFKKSPPLVFFNLTDNYGLLVTITDAQQDQTIDVYTKTPININFEVRTDESILLAIASISTLAILLYIKLALNTT